MCNIVRDDASSVQGHFVDTWRVRAIFLLQYIGALPLCAKKIPKFVPNLTFKKGNKFACLEKPNLLSIFVGKRFW